VSDDGLTDDCLRHITSWAFVHGTPKRLGIAVSGGSDSMACLDLMLWHARDKDFPVEAVTVDHGLRADAADEIALVAAYCQTENIPHTVLKWAWNGQGNLQAKARDARYSLIGEWAGKAGVDIVALGHTQDDVAETFLMRLARQSGVDGLAHMEARFERGGLTWVRPMMAHARADWRTYLQRHGIPWADDPSNDDLTFERVRARQALEALAPLGIEAETLVGVAHNMGSARHALNHYAWAEVAEHEAVVVDRGDVILPEVATSRDHLLPSEIQRRLKIAALQWISGEEYPPRSSALLNLDVGLSTGADRHTLSGCFVTRTKADSSIDRRFRITREYNAVKDLVSSTDVLWDGRWLLDGPHAPDLEVRALGEALKECPNWRETGLPRQSLLASPSVWRGETLVAAPLAGFSNSWEASATGRGTFAQFLLSR
jgi:tRNA(Ile)-lysidine synthase